MSYEYTVRIPANKRAAFRKFVASLGGSLSRARKTGNDNHEPNELTAKVLRDVEQGVNVEPFTIEDFRSLVASAK